MSNLFNKLLAHCAEEEITALDSICAELDSNFRRPRLRPQQTVETVKRFIISRQRGIDPLSFRFFSIPEAFVVRIMQVGNHLLPALLR